MSLHRCVRCAPTTSYNIDVDVCNASVSGKSFEDALTDIFSSRLNNSLSCFPRSQRSAGFAWRNENIPVHEPRLRQLGQIHFFQDRRKVKMTALKFIFSIISNMFEQNPIFREVAIWTPRHCRSRNSMEKNRWRNLDARTTTRRKTARRSTP